MKACILRIFRRVALGLILTAYATAYAKGSDDTPQRYEINIAEFSELKVTEGLRVDYKCNPDSAGMAVFTTTPDMASLLMFTNTKSCLNMQISTDGIDYTGLPHITVYSRYLTKVENSGDSLVRVLSIAPTPQLKVRLIGNGRLSVRDIETNDLDASLDTGNGVMYLQGKTLKAKYKLVGTGSIQAEELISREAKCSMLGTGYINCDVTESLSVIGASSGTVYYLGEPTIKNRSIGVKVKSVAPAE